MDLKIGSVINGFRVLRDGDVPLLNARYWKLQHEATGATLYYSDRDDGQMVFSVGFRTLPEDDTGVFHILEHSCLDGSKNYQLKEPFVNLLKTSMAVDLNAMTFEDKTIYYFISTNEQDYLNLMSVYMDAVFNPLLLTDRRIFEKEAWHIEPAGDGKVAISGVVFNEMQGNDNQPDYIMWMQNEKQLFPDLFFRFNSGGDPAYIPNLTYEQFTETYHRFYSSQNAVFYLSGNMGLEAELAHIDSVLTEKGVSAYEKPAPAPLQAPVVSPDGTVYYQLADNEEIEGNTHLMLTYVLGEDKSAEVLAFSLLSRYRSRINDGHRLVIHLNKLHCHLRNLLDISADHIHVACKQHKRLAVLTILDRIDFCHRLRVSRIATYSPNGICRIKYHTSITKHFKRLLNFCCHLIMLFLLLPDNGPKA